MINITNQNINEPLTQTETECSKFFARWTGTAICVKTPIKSHLVDHIEVASNKAISDLQESINDMTWQQESTPKYPHDQMWCFIGMCTLSVFLIALSIGSFAACVIIDGAAVSGAVKMAVFFPCMIGGFVGGGVGAVFSCIGTNYTRVRWGEAVEQYEYDSKQHLNTYKTKLKQYCAIIYRKDSKQLKEMEATIDSANKMKDLDALATQTTAMIQKVIAFLQRLKSDRLANANTTSAYVMSLPKDATPSSSDFAQWIVNEAMTQEMTKKSLNEFLKNTPNFEPKLVDLIVSYVGTAVTL